MQHLDRFLADHEDWLMERILAYAKEHGYAECAPRLEQAWRLSVRGVSSALAQAHADHGGIAPELKAQEDHAQNPMAAFGVHEARLHRERGVGLDMFLGLFKYHRRAYADLLEEMAGPPDHRQSLGDFFYRAFDLMEVAFCREWGRTPETEAIEELKRANRDCVNEKNRYMTVFESFSEPVFLVDEQTAIQNLNPAAARLLGVQEAPGGLQYARNGEASGLNGPRDLRETLIGRPLWEFFPWWSTKVLQAEKYEIKGETVRMELEADVFGNPRWLLITVDRMLDVSGRHEGAVVIFSDITEQREVREAHRVYAERLSLTMDATSDGMWDWNVETGEAFFSPRYYTMLGFEPYEFKPSFESWRQIVHPDDLDRVLDTVHRHLREAKPFEMEFRMRAKSGQWRWVLGRGMVASRNKSGEPVRMVGTHMDITARRLAEESLAQREAQLRGIFENAGSGIVLLDMHGIILRCNATFSAMAGYHGEDAVRGMRFMDFLRPDFIDGFKAALGGFDSCPAETNRTNRVLVGAGGRQAWTDQSLSMICDESGMPQSLALVCVDIEEQMRVSDALQNYSERLALATQAGEIGVWQLGLADYSLEWDERMFEIYRVKGKDFKGKVEDWSRCVHPEDLPATVKALEAAIRDKDRFDWEFRIIWPGGEVRSIKAAALIKGDEQGRAKRLIGVNWDITERKRMEEDIRTMAATDPLTGAHNRRKFMELAETEYARSRRYGHTLAVLMIDLDHFKTVNDTYGHHIGDLVLQQLTRTSIATLRSNDVFGRLGGEEFAALLVETDLPTALQVAERLRAVIAETPVQDEGVTVSIKASIGVAELKSDDQSVEDVIRNADKTLYEAKRQGRNRVVPSSGQ